MTPSLADQTMESSFRPETCALNSTTPPPWTVGLAGVTAEMAGTVTVTAAVPATGGVTALLVATTW